MAPRKKIPPVVLRWLAKLKPTELAELEQLAARRRRMLEHPRIPMDEVMERIFRDHGALLDELIAYDEMQ